MPKKWEDMAKDVAKSEVKRGLSPDEAKRIGYATATKKWGYKGEKLDSGAAARAEKKKGVK